MNRDLFAYNIRKIENRIINRQVYLSELKFRRARLCIKEPEGKRILEDYVLTIKELKEEIEQLQSSKVILSL